MERGQEVWGGVPSGEKKKKKKKKNKHSLKMVC